MLSSAQKAVVEEGVPRAKRAAGGGGGEQCDGQEATLVASPNLSRITANYKRFKFENRLSNNGSNSAASWSSQKEDGAIVAGGPTDAG